MTQTAVRNRNRMKTVSIFLIATIMMLTVACQRAAVGGHVGEKVLTIANIPVDSIIIHADSTSIRGNLELMDTSLIFVDRLFCKLFPFSIFDGKPGKPIGGLGKGPNEMMGVICGSTLSPRDTIMWILDSSNGIYKYSPQLESINFLKRLDFSWDKVQRNNYESPSVYNTMQVTNFGVTITDIGDDKVLFPLSFVNQFLDGIEVDRYQKGHILGIIDKKTLKVEKLLGSLPPYYEDTPIPMFEFFDYTVNFKDSLIYVSHAPDSLIYCYKYPDSLLYSMGFEPNGLHRDFNVGYNPDYMDFKKEIRRVSVNTGLYYDAIDNLLFRTSITDYESGNSVLQIYRDTNLIAEVKMPPFFKMLGRVGDRYYGARLKAIETEDEDVYFILYSFDKLPLNN